MPCSADVNVLVYGSMTQMSQDLKSLDSKHKNYISPKRHSSTPSLPTINVALNNESFHKYGQNIRFLTMERLQKYRACHFASDDIYITGFAPTISSPENMITALLKIPTLQRSLYARRWLRCLTIPPVPT